MPVEPVRSPATGMLARAVVRGADSVETTARRVGWLLDLLLRAWVAQSFVTAAAMRMMSPADHPVGASDVLPAWLYSVTLDQLGTVVEVGAPVLLLIGLFTRLASLALLVLAWGVIAASAGPLDAGAVILVWYVIAGAGPLSLDRPLRRGLSHAALPFSKAASQLTAFAGRAIVPPYLLLARLWAAGTAVAFLADRSGTVVLAVAAGFAILLALGLAGRAAALLLILLPLASAGMLETMSQYPTLVLLLVVMTGPGPWALDPYLVAAARAWIRRASEGSPPEVVIVGGGFAGVAAALALKDAACRVTMIDRRNYHLFQPLLYQVATGALSPADVATPIREIFREQKNARVLLAQCVGVDHDAREVVLETGRVRFDYLVLATGSHTSYFGNDEWAEAAPGLKDVDDATEIRRRLLVAFEWAEAADTPEIRQRCLTFVVIGGGPTGVELAGAIAELARFSLMGDFRAFDPADARVVLIQSADRLLPKFPERLSDAAAEGLRALGVEVRLKAKVEGFDEDGVIVAGTCVPTAAVFWTAGVAASPAARWLGEEPNDRSGRVRVSPDLSLPGRPNVFLAGDIAASDAWEGQLVPGLAASAKQMGQYVGQVLRARVNGTAEPPAFRYSHLGSLATIGRDAAVADFGRVQLTGAPAWWLWGAVHILLLTGVRNRLSVALDWLWAYFTYRQGTRLITGRDPGLWQGPRVAREGRAESLRTAAPLPSAAAAPR